LGEILALGYLRDFQRVWEEEPSQSPKAVLAFPQHISLKMDKNDAGRDLVFLAAGDRDRWASFIKMPLNAA
jgi:hypothetical protein